MVRRGFLCFDVIAHATPVDFNRLYDNLLELHQKIDSIQRQPMSNIMIKSVWPWMPTTQLKPLPKHTNPELDALAQMEALEGLSRQVIWRYGDLFDVIMEVLLGQVQPLGFYRGQLVAAVVDDGLSDEVLAQCAQQLWHVQTSSPRVCALLGPHVPSFHVSSMACVQALAPHQPQRLTVSLNPSDATGWPVAMTSHLTLAPAGFKQVLDSTVIDELLCGQWRTISIEFDASAPSDAQRQRIQSHASCQTFTWLGGQLGQPVRIERAPALWSSPGFPRHFIPLMCIQNHMAQMWMMWDCAVKRPRAMRCDGYSLESLGRPGPFGVLPAVEKARGPWSLSLPGGAGWACSFLNGGARQGNVFVGPGRRFAVLRCFHPRHLADHAAYQDLWDQHPQRGGAVWLETDKQLAEGTFTSLVFEGDEAVIEWCSMQRVYRFRDGALTCLTTDHTLRQLMPDTPAHFNADNIVLVSIGHDLEQLAQSIPTPWTYQRRVKVQAGDRFLLTDAMVERTFGQRQLTQWMSASTPFDVAHQMQHANTYGYPLDYPTLVIDSDATVEDINTPSGPWAYNFEGSEARDLERLVCDEPLVLNSATLFMDPERFDGQRVEFAGVLNFPDVHTRLVADAWWNAPYDQSLPEHGTYIVRARGLWCADGGRYGEGGQFVSEFRGHLDIVEPVAQMHVPSDEAHWYRYMMFSSDGLVQQTPDGWFWHGRPMQQGGPLSAQVKWPTVDKPQQRPARIVAAACHSLILVFSMEWLGPPEPLQATKPQ